MTKDGFKAANPALLTNDLTKQLKHGKSAATLTNMKRSISYLQPTASLAQPKEYLEKVLKKELDEAVG